MKISKKYQPVCIRKHYQLNGISFSVSFNTIGKYILKKPQTLKRP